MDKKIVQLARVKAFALLIFVVITTSYSLNATAQRATPNFGDNASGWANDGECDDPRFEGDGMAATLVEDDRLHDASDCRSLFNTGSIRLVGSRGTVDFGDDNSTWANDDECDDPRFEGDGMANSLLDDDRLHDATDCRTLFNNGSIRLASSVNTVDFGDNSGSWANDDECDDPRFEGDGMASTLLDDDRMHDASDCRSLYNAGSIQLLSTDSLATNGIDFGDNASTWADNTECDDPRFEGRNMASILIDSDMFHDARDCSNLFASGDIRLVDGSNLILGSRIERGTLAKGDDTRGNDAYADRFTFNADRGDNAVIDLLSGDFDTYLIVRTPSGEEFSNDDYESSFDRSLLSLSLTETGIYEVLVSSYAADETGGYTVEIQTDSDSTQFADQQINGTLAAGDDTYNSGEYVDSYTFEGRPGQRISVSLQSSDFDTYLILHSPNGESESNDDANGTESSLIETQLSEVGTYEVFVTSYAAEEVGDYSLIISEAAVGGTSSQQANSAAANTLSFGDNISGRLSSDDRLSDDDEYQDSYVFSADAGTSITVDMTSTDVDTYLSLITPSGESIENDDHQGSTDQSLLQLTLQESGRYRIIASSYASGETGAYQLSLRSGGNSANSNASRSTSGGQIYGIFAGIADYPGEGNDLSLTDQDARRARDALIEGAGMDPNNAYTLIDSDATRANFQQALDDIGSNIGQDDTLVIFYSGHGSRVPRAAGPDSSDPDGMDETMELYDGALIDDELSDMLDNINAGTILLVMDSCFSGGFSKDIISKPGRMGLFSSEEDVTSQVAFKFQAGGYLSVFFDEAIRGGYADRDDNGEVTAIELSEYLHGRFRADVKAFGDESYVRTSGPQASYQHLVVDRGGVGPYNVLFNRQ